MTIANNQFASQFATLIEQAIAGTITASAFSSSLSTLIDTWNGGSVSNQQLNTLLTTFIATQQGREGQLQAWFNGTATGGKGANGTGTGGYYPFTDVTGLTTYAPSPALIGAPFAGPPGTAATVQVGTVTTGPAAVTNAGSATAAVLNFSLPPGAKGDRGDPGQTGLTGQAGLPGAAATISFTTPATLPAGASATATNSGSPTAAVITLGLPQGPQPWTVPIAFASGLNASTTAPATTVTYGGSTYVCKVAHTTTSTFVAANWTLIAAKGADGTGTGTVSPTGALTVGHVAVFASSDGTQVADGGQLSTVATTGAYADLSGRPTLSTVAGTGAYGDLTGKPALATVATSGSYIDLTGRPALFSGAYGDLSGKPTLSTVAGTGAYSDLSGKPALATVATTGAYTDLTGRPTISTVGVSGNYADLLNKPGLFSGSWTDLTNKPSLFSGSYTDLINKPAFSTVATSGSYNDLTSRPALSTVAASGAYGDLAGRPDLSVYLTNNSQQYLGYSAWKGFQSYPNNTSVAASTAGDVNALSVYSDGGAPAIITFHRHSQYATFFGLDSDNEFVRGGWSDGQGRWRFWTERNVVPLSDGSHLRTFNGDATNWITTAEVQNATSYTYDNATGGGTWTFDFNGFISTAVILNANTTFAATNLKNGRKGSIRLRQDGAGGRIASWTSTWKFPGGVAPTLSTAANAVDYLFYETSYDGIIYAVVQKGFA